MSHRRKLFLDLCMLEALEKPSNLRMRWTLASLGVETLPVIVGNTSSDQLPGTDRPLRGGGGGDDDIGSDFGCSRKEGVREHPRNSISRIATVIAYKCQSTVPIAQSGLSLDGSVSYWI